MALKYILRINHASIESFNYLIYFYKVFYILGFWVVSTTSTFQAVRIMVDYNMRVLLLFAIIYFCSPGNVPDKFISALRGFCSN